MWKILYYFQDKLVTRSDLAVLVPHSDKTSKSFPSWNQAKAQRSRELVYSSFSWLINN